MGGSLITWLITGSIGGWLSGYLMHRDKTFDLSDVVVGVLGAFVGGLIMMFIPFLSFEGFIGDIIVSLIGACALTWGYEWYRRREMAG